MKVWVLGGGGMLGQAVVRQLQQTGVRALASGREVDIAQAHAVLAFAGDQRVTHLINCAAYTQVDACEQAQDAAHAVNAAGPGHVGQAAARLGAVAVHISTDYVFDGRAATPYVESAPSAPLGVYGRSKHTGEQNFLRAFAEAAPERSPAAARGFVVRTSWLFGHGGTGNFVRTMLRLMRSREAVGVVADQVGCPTYCEHLAAAVLRLAGLGSAAGRSAAPGIYHYANRGATSWHGFATEILQQASDLQVPLACKTVRPLTTAQYPTPAPRPAYSVLSTEKISSVLGEAPPPWREALQTYMKRWVQAPE